jgi:hypothetical protein
MAFKLHHEVILFDDASLFFRYKLDLDVRCFSSTFANFWFHDRLTLPVAATDFLYCRFQVFT